MNPRRLIPFAALLVLLVFGVAGAAPAPRAADGNRDSTAPSISADGRFVVFASEDFDLVPDDLNLRGDVFLYDRVSGETTLLSRGSGIEQQRRESSEPVISANGRFVAYSTWEKTLLPAGMDTFGIVVLDRDTGALTLVSRSTSGVLPRSSSEQPAISADGRYVAFLSDADELIDGDRDHCYDADLWYCLDLYLHDRTTGQTIAITRSPNNWFADGSSNRPAISADGGTVVFDSLATNLLGGQPAIPADTSQVYAYDVAGEQLSLVSRSSAGGAADGESFAPSVSPDGRLVAFVSRAMNLVPGTPAVDNIYLRDRDTGQTTLLTRGIGGANANGGSGAPAFSPDGRFLAFSSLASNLVPGDDNDRRDVFVYDLEAAALTLVSRSGQDAPGDGDSDNPAIAGGGLFVAFETRANNLDGEVDDQTLDIALRDRQTSDTRLITARPLSWQGNSESRGPAISADGRVVAFESYAANLVPGDNNNRWDIFVYDAVTRKTTLIGRDGPVVTEARYPVISADGQVVTFQSYHSFDQPDEGYRQVYVHDRRTGVTELVSRAADGSPGNWHSDNPTLSADGRYVVFSSGAANLVPDGDGEGRIFVYDRQTSALRRLRWADMGLDEVWAPGILTISADGQAIAFEASIPVEGGWLESHVLVYDQATGETARVTPVAPRDFALGPVVGNFSADGRYLTYAASMVVPGDNDTNNTYDVYVYDRQTEVTWLISRSPTGQVGNSLSHSPTLSADGRYVVFISYADNLAPIGDRYPVHVYLHDRQTGETKLVMPGLGINYIDYGEHLAGLSSDGRWLAAASDAPVVSGDSNGLADVFLYDRTTEQVKLISGLIPGPYRFYTPGVMR